MAAGLNYLRCHRLQGLSLDVTLGDALRPVPNPQSDPAIAQLNRIRWVRPCGGEGREGRGFD